MQTKTRNLHNLLPIFYFYVTIKDNIKKSSVPKVTKNGQSKPVPELTK